MYIGDWVWVIGYGQWDMGNVAKTFGLDENANKEVEEDIVLTQTDEDED